MRRIIADNRDGGGGAGSKALRTSGAVGSLAGPRKFRHAQRRHATTNKKQLVLRSKFIALPVVDGDRSEPSIR
jgi:hypothetical protein